jgi:hypothetical protein
MATFHDWNNAGFGVDLLPIIPPGASLTVGTTLDPSDVGKVPGKLHGKRWSGFASWFGHVAGPADMAAWTLWQSKSGAGVGLQSRSFPGVDIDVTDQSLSDAIAVLADLKLGDAPERVGRAPKRLLVYRIADGEVIRKKRVDFTAPDGSAHAVEILGAGQQYVVEGMHPGTGRPYAWTSGRTPETIGAANLTTVTAAQVDAFLDEVENLVAASGGTVINRSGGTGTALVAVSAPPPSALKGDPALIEEALGVLGNDFDYQEWIKLCAAVKAALGADEANYPIFEAWCLLHPQNTPAVARAKWDSLKPPYHVGADFIYRKATDAGWAGIGAALGFEPVDEDDPATQSNLPPWLTGWAYAMEIERFVRLSDALCLKEQQFARLFASPGVSATHKDNPATLWHQHPAKKLVDGVTYLPGAPALVRIDGSTRANLWREPPGLEAARIRSLFIQDSDVAPWLDHMELMIPDARVRGLFLDFFAYVLQHPDRKPNWAIFLGGEHGIGKDLAVQPLYRGVGQKHTRTVQPGELASEYTSWMTNKRLVIVEEMRNFETKTVMNKLKLYITRPPETVPVHEKFMNIYETPNVACFIFMSNFQDALSLERGDRRFFVYWSPMKPQPPSYYDGLSAFIGGAGGDEVVAWLLARDIRGFDAQGRAPDTSDKRMMEEAGRSDFAQAIVEAIEGAVPPFHAPLATLSGLWATLPVDIKRLPGASLKHLGAAIKAAGGEQVVDLDGKPKLVRLDVQGEQRFGAQRLWALRDPAQWAGADPDVLRTAFRSHWVSDNTLDV